MANNTLQQIATNLGVTGYDDTSLLIGIAEYYGVNPNQSKCLMFDILEAQGGDAANSVNYMEDLVVTLSGTANSLNVIEEWETITAGPPVYFTTTWTTTIPNETITLPYDPAGTYSGTIDWGDNSTDVNSFANSSHTYALAGTYTVEIIGDCIGWNFGSYGSATYITSVVHWGQLELGANNAGYFNSCTNLDLSLVSDILNLQNITNLSQMFANSNTITINNINLWDTGQVTSMSSMFNGATNFNQALSFNTENVNDMNSMFANASSFNGILSLSTGSVTDMGNMFYNASSFNQPLAFVTEQVVNMNAMFYGATNFNQNIGAWDVSIVNDFQDFMASKTPATFSTANLDAIYNGWSEYDVILGLSPVDFGTAKYSPAGIVGRARLTNVFLWNINDGGL